MTARPAGMDGRESENVHGVWRSCAVTWTRAAGAVGTTGAGVVDGTTGGRTTGAGVPGVDGVTGAGLAAFGWDFDFGFALGFTRFFGHR
jgi:hypothetical protein